MSCSQWESGTIRLPSKLYIGFRRGFIESVKKREALEALTIVNAYKAIPYKKGTALTRGQCYAAFDAALTRAGLNYEQCVTGMYTVLDAAVAATTPSAFKIKPDTTGATRSWSGGEWSVAFSDVDHSVQWYVEENNHACDRARESFLGVILFSALKRVAWTRGSGGEIVGNDEYNQESSSVGGGGNYLVSKFGPSVVKPTRKVISRR